MGHTSYKYDQSDTVIYRTSDTDIDDTERFTDDIDLTELTGASVDFEYTPSDATNDLEIVVYNRRDSSWDGNERAWKSTITVPNDGNVHLYHYTIPEDYQAGHYRFGMKSSGSTTSFDMQVSIRKVRKTKSIA